MARYRTVKPQYFNHPEILELSIPARYLFIALWTYVDDAGRTYDQPRRIEAHAFGDHDRVKIDTLLDELETHNKIRRYAAGGRRCIEVVNFNRHQPIPKSKFKPSTVPENPAFVSGGQQKSFQETAETLPGRNHFAVEPQSLRSPSTALNKELGIRSKELGVSKAPYGESGDSPGEASAQDLVKRYVASCSEHGITPSRTARDQVGVTAKRLLGQYPIDLIEAAIDVAAEENKPGRLDLIVMDLQRDVHRARSSA